MFKKPANGQYLFPINRCPPQPPHERRNVPNLLYRLHIFDPSSQPTHRLRPLLRLTARNAEHPTPRPSRMDSKILRRKQMRLLHRLCSHICHPMSMPPLPFPQPPPPPHKTVKPRMCPVPTEALLKAEAILPPLLINVVAHIYIPALPRPLPARIRHLRVRDVNSRGLVPRIYPGRRVEV